MSQYPGDEQRPDLSKAAKDYFARRHLDPNELPTNIYNKFVHLTEEQAEILDQLGEALEKETSDVEKTKLEMYVFVIH